jgi:hypothetical protein
MLRYGTSFEDGMLRDPSWNPEVLIQADFGGQPHCFQRPLFQRIKTATFLLHIFLLEADENPLRECTEMPRRHQTDVNGSAAPVSRSLVVLLNSFPN